MNTSVAAPLASPRARVSDAPAAPPTMAQAEAFAAMYRETYPRVLGYLLRRTGSVAEAEDLASETFAIAWKAAHDDVPHPGWVFVTARNVLANHRRAAVRVSELQMRAEGELRTGRLPGFAVPREPVNAETQRLLAAMDLLPEAQRELLVAHYWDGLTGAECAQLAGCSPAATWIRLHRARRALAELFLQHPELE
ncbi:MAG: RNA polymerase sigma factor [Micrococcales bacterium]|nr:RNA polymerase sigma factor [Micrococcales bacterium]